MQPIALKCPSCGGNLQITPDMETFACGYCGTQQIVRREGGTVSLKIIGEAIAGVKASTDRIAAELEIRRLRDDAEQIDREVQKLDKQIGEAKTAQKKPSQGVACGSLLLIGIPAALIGGMVFRYEWWVAIIVAFVSAALCINLYHLWNISHLERSKAAKVQQRVALNLEISNRIANLR